VGHGFVNCSPTILKRFTVLSWSFGKFSHLIGDCGHCREIFALAKGDQNDNGEPKNPGRTIETSGKTRLKPGAAASAESSMQFADNQGGDDPAAYPGTAGADLDD
jgi:hypothetical protein